MRLSAAILATAAATAAVSGGAAAQGVPEILATIRDGGSWVSVPIEHGHGTVSSILLPTMGLKLSGCINVWEGHTGQWEIRARDTIAQDSLRMTSRPGQGVRFTHEFGLRSQIEFDFQWSEPRDTTLFLWVGVDRADDGPDEACTPK
jgi:hypothetical protein